jgi:pyridinium-3,5-bisthiocarboxylic acid mononucleotide nickel chelatase
LTVLYFDCFSGAAGDMILGALLDAGVPAEVVREQLDALELPQWNLRVDEVRRAGIRATKVNVVASTDRRRPYRDIVSTIEAARLSEAVAARALATFEVLARAEARVHGLELDDVHFHEVGSLDSIIDVVGVAAALEHLAPDRIVTSALPVGTGTVRGSHGILPVPPPAVVEVIRSTGVIIEQRGHGELVTPTGAALLAANSDSFGPLPAMTVHATGYGAGTRDMEMPNVLRVFVGEARPTEVGGAVVIDCNIDDMTPELLPYVIGRLLEAGAQDAWVTPVVMKKGRPGFTLSVLARPPALDVLTRVVFEETSALGLRVSKVDKVALEREWFDVEVEGALVRVKVGRLGSRVVSAAPEYDDAEAAAHATGLPLKEIYERARAEARRRVGV